MMDTKPSRKVRDERERNRDSIDEYRYSSKDHRDRDHKHRSSKQKSRDADEDHHLHHASSEKHRSKHRDRGGDDNHRSRDEREGSRDRAHYNSCEREGSGERAHHRDKRERSHEREGSRDRALREESVEIRHHKRKERGDSEDRFDGGEKRARASDEVKEERKERKDRRRFEDRDADGGREVNGGAKTERSEKRRFEDGVKGIEARDANVSSRGEKRERRKFGDKVKREGMDVDGEGKQGVLDEKLEKKEPRNELFDNDQVAAVAPNGNGSIENVMASRKLLETSFAPSRSPPTKVSSISTTNENKGVNITGSHEIPGKSSTDGTASAGKSGNLTLDALAKAKRALQMKKDLQERLNRLPLTNKGESSEGSPQVGSKEGLKGPSSSSGLLPTPACASTLSSPAAASVNPPASVMAPQAALTVPNVEAVKRAQELAAKMGFRQDPQFAPLINMFPGQMPPEVTYQTEACQGPGSPFGCTGSVPCFWSHTSINSLKVLLLVLTSVPETNCPEKNPHFDARMGIDSKKLLRPKRASFLFVEEGKWSKEAEIVKLKSQFGEAQAKELKAKQAQLAKAKAEPDINPNLIEVSERVIIKQRQKESIPEIEWWDQPLLHSGTYGDIPDGIIAEDKLRMDKVTIYVEHPRPIEPPAEPAPPPPQPLKLTKKEQKKLPTQDPTRLEMEIRSAAAEREQAHIDRNIARKLTPDERREKKERKLFDDPNTQETIVSVYKVNDFSHPQTRFKVDVNAQENRMTGCAVISDGISVVVVEGGNKSIKRYGKLMLKRINWASAVKTAEEEGDEDEEKPVNKCLLVWQGSVAKPSFHRFSVHECRTEAAARKVFSDAGVGHYWDLAVNFTEDQM
ncbi:pre-mRNA-splicing factor 3 [Actinidia rufa]|uniref:Pre-mRNA-splicing factor 3 n=1 Tax=Actinidia rufa TaxID=165716 RepID=A0A7J0GVQ4_9ERIC|nr:pre-mRNA-splicing factor 3 [Actinidia rufa]